MSVLIADSLDDDVTRHAYAGLRSARRRPRIENLDFFDAFYKAYVTAIFGAVAIYAAAGAFGDKTLTAAQLHDVRVDGPVWLGLLAAVAIATGLRSGGRGGPMAFERADVRHLLMAPVDRRYSMRRPFLRKLRYATFVGVTVGAAAGLVAGRRMPDKIAEWVIAGGVFGAGLAVAAFASAAIAAGYRLKVWMVDVLALLVVGWSVADVWFDVVTSPLSFLGKAAVWPLDFEPLAFIGLVVAAMLALWGTGVVNRSSIEAAERRSRLVGQLRFAATLQDVRTVMVLQRQLSQEQVRQKPWFRLPRRKGLGFSRRGHVHRRVFFKRALHGMLRWPALRLARLVFFSMVAGFAGLGVWAGTSPLVVVVGVALWMAALDVCEPLAQEVDHPDRLKSSAQQQGVIYLQHLFVPLVVLLVLGVMAFIPAFILGDADVVGSLLPLTVFAAGCAVAGASLVLNARPPGEVALMDTAETASLKFVWRVLVPPGLAVVGCLPLVAAHRAWQLHHSQSSMVEATNTLTLVALVCISLAFAWLRFGDQVREGFSADAVAAAKKSAEKKKAQQAAKASKEETGQSAKSAGRDAAKAKNKATQNKRKKR
jgi:hypothetical protein